MSDVVGIGIDLTQHVPLVTVAVCPAAIRPAGTVDASILTRHWPPKVVQREGLHPQIPCVVLPIHLGEPLLVAGAAAEHRRSAGLPWPPEAQVPYDNDFECGVARVPLAAAWSALLPLAMEEESISRRDDPEFRWHPEGREHVAHAGQMLAASIKAFLTASKVPFTSRLTCIVVPDALDEGGQQILLESLSRVGLATDKIHLLPRPLAVALNWCATADTAALIPNQEEGGVPVGRLRVLTTALDLWEAVSLEVRSVRHAGRSWFVPVRDRAKLAGILPELQTPGMSYPIALARASTKAVPFSWWGSVLGSDWLVRRLAAPRALTPEELQVLREFRSSAFANNLPPEFAQLDVLHPLWKRLREGRSSLRGSVPEHWDSQERQIDVSKLPCKAVLADGALAQLRMENGIPLGQYFAQVSPAAAHLTALLTGHTAAAHGAAVAAAAIASGLPCYRETLLPLDLYVLGKDDLGDPKPRWRELVAAKSVEAGRTWKSPEPVEGLQIREGQDCILLPLRRELRGQAMFRKVASEILKPPSRDEPVSINVEVKPGQGFALVRIDSKAPGLFTSRLDWRTMAPCGEPEAPKLSYPPGVSEVLPDKEMFERAQSCLRAALSALEQASPYVKDRLRDAIALMNKWPLAHNVERTRGRRVKKDINRHYGILGSEGTLDNLPAPGLARGLRNAVGDAFASLIQRGTARSSLGGSLLRMAGWFYIAIPDQCLWFLRSRLDHATHFNSQLSAVELHAIGLSFGEPKDISLFFPLLTKALRNPEAKPNNWLRAARNIIRFRNDALSPLTVSDKVISELVAQLYEVMLEQAKAGNFARIFANCLESLAFLLKRRRYDPEFLEPSSPLAADLIKFLQQVDQRYALRLPKRLQTIPSSTVNFLRMEATETDLENLLGVDDDDGGDDD